MWFFMAVVLYILGFATKERGALVRGLVIFGAGGDGQ